MRKVRWPERKKTFDMIVQLRKQGMTSEAVALELNAQNLKTKKGLNWTRGKLDSFFYTCKKSGMRIRESHKSKQIPLIVSQQQSFETTTPIVPKNVSFESSFDDEKLNIMKTIIDSRLPNNKKFDAIVAVLR